jgi:hypothetical protein
MINQTPNPNKIETQFPNLLAYLDEDELSRLIPQHTILELNNLEAAFDQIESAMIQIRLNAEVPFLSMIWTAIGSIWDNSRDLLYD